MVEAVDQAIMRSAIGAHTLPAAVPLRTLARELDEHLAAKACRYVDHGTTALPAGRLADLLVELGYCPRASPQIVRKTSGNARI